MTDERLAEIRAEAERRPRREYGQTKVDELLSEIARLREREKALEAVAEAARGLRDALDRYWDQEGMKVVHAGVGQAHLGLGDALAALEGKPPGEPSHAH